MTLPLEYYRLNLKTGWGPTLKQLYAENSPELLYENDYFYRPPGLPVMLWGVYALFGNEPLVARQMMAHDALNAHARDELGISDISTARPLQAAIASALTFIVGAAAPLLVVPFAPLASMVVAVAAASLVCLAVLGALGAKAGGAPVVPSVARVVFWGAMAMVVTALVGKLFGAAVA